ncbi:hypothetical protein ACOMHN_048082 [Nucella lapillus]
MPKYNGNITLYTEHVFPGGDLEGEVTFTASKNCTLKDAKLELVCRAYYHHNGRKKCKHEQPTISISLVHRDGHTVQAEERLTEINRPTRFKFRTQLHTDLLPTTTGCCRDILDVSYTLKLSTKRGFFGSRITDASTAFTVLSLLDLRSPEFSTMAFKEVTVHNMQFGQGFDLQASARMSRLGWEALQTVLVRLKVHRISDTNSHSLTAHLERTISYRNKSTIRNIASSRSIRIPGEPRPYELSVVIPDDAPVSGVMYCPTLSVHYRIRVEIKCTANSVPTFTLSLPIVVGTKQRLLTSSSSSDEGGPKEDLLKGPGETGHWRRAEPESQSYFSCGGQSDRSSRPDSQHYSSRGGQSDRSSRPDSQPYSSHGGQSDRSSLPRTGRHHPRSGENGPTMPSSVTSSGRQSTHSGPGRHQPRSGDNRHTPSSSTGRPTMPTPVDMSSGSAADRRQPEHDEAYCSAERPTCASVDTQTSLSFSYGNQRFQQSSTPEHPASSSSSGFSQSRLDLANPSSCPTESSSAGVFSASGQTNSLESSGPQAMGHAHLPPLNHSGRHSTQRKQPVSAGPPPIPGNWQASLRCYDGQTTPHYQTSSSPQNSNFPSHSWYGAVAHDPSTEVKSVASGTMTPRPGAAGYGHNGHEVDSSDRQPLCPPSTAAAAKKARKRRNSP